MIQEYSRYKDYKIATKGRVFFGNLSDFFLCLILAFVLFATAGNGIVRSLPSTQTNLYEVNNATLSLRNLITKTHLRTFDSSGTKLRTISEDANDYIVTLMKTSYYLNGEKYPALNDNGTYSVRDIEESETFLFKGEVDEEGYYSYPHDGPSYYFLNFKEKTASLSSYVYENVDRKEEKEEYMYQKIFAYDPNDFQLTNERAQVYYALKLDVAKALVDYRVYKDSSSSLATINNRIESGYRKAINFFQEEVQNKYDRYIEQNKRFEAAYARYLGQFAWAISICYVFAFFILELILPLFLKEGSTLGLKMMKLVYCGTDEGNPPFHSFIIKGLIRFLMHFWGMIIGLLMIGLIQVALFDLGGGFRLVYLFIGSGVISIFSIGMLIFTPKNQGLAEFPARLVLKDKGKHEQGQAKEMETKEKGRSYGRFSNDE